MTFIVGSYQALERQQAVPPGQRGAERWSAERRDGRGATGDSDGESVVVRSRGAGHRASSAVLWRGEDLRTRSDVAMTVLPAGCAEAARLQVESVAGIDHPHLLPVIDVAADEDRLAVVSPWPAGGRLAELVLRRGALTSGETLTVLIPVASALAAAHEAGIRHGGVCPEMVWFDARGRPLLGALAVSRLIAELNDGMPAGSHDVAPEVVRGERLRGRNGLTVAADIFSLGSVALYCLTGRSAWPADDPADVLIQSAAGLWPDLPDDVGPVALVALVRAMLSAEPDSRPTAQEVATQLARLGEPAPIAFTSGPAPASATTDRWRGWNAAGTGQAESGTDADRSGTDGADTDGPGVDAESDADEDSGLADEVFDPADRGALRGRLLNPRSARPLDPDPPTPLTPIRRAGIALLVGVLITIVGVQVGGWLVGWDRPDDSVSGASTPAGTPWPEVVAGLDAARGQALAAADPALLSAVYADANSSARGADAATIAHLASKGWRVVDGVHDIVSVALDSPEQIGSSGNDGTVRLAVVDTLPPRAIVDLAGEQVGVTTARAEQRSILVLSPTADGYRILAVEPG